MVTRLGSLYRQRTRHLRSLCWGKSRVSQLASTLSEAHVEGVQPCSLQDKIVLVPYIKSMCKSTNVACIEIVCEEGTCGLIISTCNKILPLFLKSTMCINGVSIATLLEDPEKTKNPCISSAYVTLHHYCCALVKCDT